MICGYVLHITRRALRSFRDWAHEDEERRGEVEKLATCWRKQRVGAGYSSRGTGDGW